MKESSDDPAAEMARSGLREYAPDPATDDGGVKNLANAGNEPVEVSTDAIHVEHINPDAWIRLGISIEFVEQFQSGSDQTATPTTSLSPVPLGESG